MAKKDEEVVETTSDESVEEVSQEKSGIAPLDNNLNREDLNAVVAKVNEIIEVVNNSKAV